MTAPRVSAIVVSYNRADDLELSLKALCASNYPDLQVIVVDNASSDDAAERAARFPGVELIRSPENLGFAKGNNLGLARASGEYVALVNNDAVVAPDWVARSVELLETLPDAAAVGGKHYFWTREHPVGDRKSPYFAYSTLTRDGDTPHARDASDALREVATLTGSAVMLRRAAIDAVGEPFLDPAYFMYYEETDFFARALKKGYRLYYSGNLECWHRVTLSHAERSYNYHYYMQRNRVLFAHRHFDVPELEYVRKKARDRAARAELLRTLGLFRREPDRDRASRDAWRWIEENGEYLAEERARHYGSEPSYTKLARAAQERAGYYDQGRPELRALVPETARFVVDVGCGAGGLGKALKAARPEIQVRGIEIVPAEADRARSVLDDVLVGSADIEALPAHWPRPDCVIFADVLEHMNDPWTVLRKFHDWLAPDGCIVVSLPNVGHHEVLGGLLKDRWDYAESGILDRTHVRFFTRSTATELMEACGYRVTHMQRHLKYPGSDFKRTALEWLTAAQRKREQRQGMLQAARRATFTDICTYQFMLVARPVR